MTTPDPTPPHSGARPGGGYPESWSERWGHLARSVSLAPGEPLLLALSGGADSTYLLCVLAAARERPAVTAVHIDHGLRGSESERDAAFCAQLCRELGVPLVTRKIELTAEGPSLEARAREARYRALAREAQRQKCNTVITGHHADDNLETLLMRWIRGTSLTGLAALKSRLELQLEGVPLTVVRPLIGLRREEVRERLQSAGLAWCEDSSNASTDFTRNRVRHVFIPGIQAVAGEGGVENLRAFGRAVEELESHLARATADLCWRPTAATAACRGLDQSKLGGSLARAELMRLPFALRRRALWRLILEGTGRAPRRSLLEVILDDLGRGRCTRHALPADYGLQLRAATLELQPPHRVLDAALESVDQPRLPFPEPQRSEPLRFLPFGSTGAAVLAPGLASSDAPGLAVGDAVGSTVGLADGRSISLELTRGEAHRAVPRGRTEVELDAAVLHRPLTVRWPRPGDRFRPLGAPGSRPLRRILADWGVPRAERERVPLVVAGDEIVWVAGMRPSHGARVLAPAPDRVQLKLHRAAEADPAQPSAPQPRARVLSRGQRSFFESH